jgi:hypothetical protein
MSDDVRGDWTLAAVGVLFVVAGVLDFFSGRTGAAYRDRCGLVHRVTIDGEQNPIQFLIRVMISLLVGTALITYAVWRLVA